VRKQAKLFALSSGTPVAALPLHSRTGLARGELADLTMERRTEMISGISGVSSYSYLQQLRQYESQSGSMSAQDVFNKIDANGDGSIGKDEFSAFQSTMQTQFQNSIVGSPTDSTSLLSLLQAITQGATTNSPSGTADQLFSKIDANGDGSISRDELAKAQATMHHHQHHSKSSNAASQATATSPLDELFGKIDANGDGSISKDELGAFQSSLEAQLTGSATSAVSDQQSQAGGIRSLLTQAMSMYMKLNPLLSAAGSFAAIG
jgi:Ca2+-binding EF-hand superfamily protein